MKSRSPRPGFNLVEILITLTLLAIVTSVVINFVRDYQSRVKIVRTRNDLTRLAQMSMLAESRSGELITTLSTFGTEPSTLLDPYILALPAEDPWGNRYVLDPLTGEVERREDEGFAYVVDQAYGRIISPGPDGVCNTRVGAGPSALGHDIVVDYRKQQWLLYAFQDEVWICRTDGSNKVRFLAAPSGAAPWTGSEKLANVTISPNGTRITGLIQMPTSEWRLFAANVDQINPDAKVVMDRSFMNADSFPVWFPNSRHVLMIHGGKLYLVDTMRPGWSLSSGSALYSEQVFPDPCDLSNSIIRSLVLTERVTSYMVNGMAYVTMSVDGKIAFAKLQGTRQGIYVCLADGTGLKRIVAESAGISYYPLLWITPQELCYLSSTNQFKRVNQDGNFNFGLHPDADTIGGHPSGIAPSPNGDLLSFKLDSSGIFVLSMDGSGFYKASSGGTSVVMASGDGALGDARFVPTLWAERLPKRFDRYSYGAEVKAVCLSSRFVSTDPVNDQERIHEIPVLANFKHNAMQPVSTNTRCGVYISSMDLDATDNLVAMISRRRDNDAEKNAGVYVWSWSGPHNALTQIADFGIGNGATYAYIRWLGE